VCASSAPDSGRKQDLPRAESKAETKQQSENLEVVVDRTSQSINGVKVSDVRFLPELKSKLRAKTRPEDRIVVVKSDKATPYDQWVKVTGWISESGGVVTLQMEEEKTVTVQ
jgi:biopolymer transport protein ExbD